MNEMLAFPFMVGVIIGTALLSSIVTSALPYMPKYWHAIKMRIKRIFTPKQRLDQHNLDVIVEQINDLQQQVNNLAEAQATKDKNRKSNIRRDVRDYLKELQND